MSAGSSESSSCPFCAIAAHFAPASPTAAWPPSNSSSSSYSSSSSSSSSFSSSSTLPSSPPSPSATSPAPLPSPHHHHHHHHHRDNDHTDEPTQRQQQLQQSSSPLTPTPLPLAAAGPGSGSGADSDSSSASLAPPAFVLLSSPLCMAFLDIMPLSPGHLLLTTRAHHRKLSEVSAAELRELGYWVGVLSRVLARATGVWDWNVLQNNGAAAAQVVPHVHFHIIPRPALTPELRNRSFTMFGRGQRTDLDEEEAAVLIEKLREELANELESMKRDSSTPKL